MAAFNIWKERCSHFIEEKQSSADNVIFKSWNQEFSQATLVKILVTVVVTKEWSAELVLGVSTKVFPDTTHQKVGSGLTTL